MSNNLNLDQMAAGQSQPEQTVNDIAGQLDAAITESMDSDLSAGNDTLTAAEFRGNIRFVGTGMTQDRSITVYNSKHVFIVYNPSTSYNLSVIRGSTTIILAPGVSGVFYTDGTTNGLWLVASRSPDIYEAASFNAGAPSASQIMLRRVFTVACATVINFVLSRADADVAATSSTDFDIQKNGVSIGTLNFAGSATAGTFTVAAAQSFAAGDVLSIVAPGTPDATLADISITIQTRRT